MGSIGLTFLGILLFLTSVFMMLLILVQRGKGGGLTALGGMGGQSAFGAKAGDVFTRITVITAIIWITLCMITIAAFNPPPRNAGLDTVDEIPTMSAIEEDEADTDAEGDQESSAGDAGSLDEQAQDFISDVVDEESSENESSTQSNQGDGASAENKEPPVTESTGNESPDSDDDK